jgi:HEAT repeats
MSKTDDYRTDLRAESDWDAYLTAHSGLPGPRGNIELALAAGDLASPERIEEWLLLDVVRAPTNTPEEFLAFCGVIGLGRLLKDGDESALSKLRRSASDPRWRVREAVAMALQGLGDDDFDRLLSEMRSWAAGDYLEQRAAAAALCEPRLLAPERVADVIEVLDSITASLAGRKDRRGDEFKTLRKGLGYCWSVAVAAAPSVGRPAMERWVGHDDPDIRWVMRENLRKKRLQRMDGGWVARQLEAVEA